MPDDLFAAAAEDRLVRQAPLAARMRPTSLDEVVGHLRGDALLEAHPPHREAANADPWAEVPDMADVRGLTAARLAVEVMVAGGHNLLLHGPPGVAPGRGAGLALQCGSCGASGVHLDS